jgi:hypothetical protein
VKYWVKAKTPITLGDATFELAAELGAPVADKRGDATIVSLRSTCLDVKASVPTSNISTGGQGFGSGGTAGKRGNKLGERWLLVKGTQMFSPSMKRKVAVLSTTVEILKPDPAASHVCIHRTMQFERSPREGGPNVKTPKRLADLQVCAPATAVKHVNDAPARP